MSNMTKITRRNFMKLTGLMTGAVMLQPGLKYPSPVSQVNFKDLLIRAEGGGKLIASRDNGVSWGVLFQFGDHLRINDLYIEQGKLFSTLEVMGHRFTLDSMDGLIWKTT